MKRTLGALALITSMIVGCGKMPDQKLMDSAKKFETKQKYAEAAADYDKLAVDFSQSPFSAEALYRGGLLYANALQQLPKAIKNFQNVTEHYPDSPFAAQAQFMIGFLYANTQSDTANARAAYEAFLAKYPKNELAQSVQWELDNLGKDINEILKVKESEPKAAPAK
jgi:TolA-binding protein